MFDEFEKYAEKTFVGFCTEPEMKYLEKGGVSCKFSIPLNDKHKDEKPLWLNCKAWNETAEAFADEVFYNGSVGISDAQLYKIVGNSVTLNVIYEIAKEIREVLDDKN